MLSYFLLLAPFGERRCTYLYYCISDSLTNPYKALWGALDLQDLKMADQKKNKDRKMQGWKMTDQIAGLSQQHTSQKTYFHLFAGAQLLHFSILTSAKVAEVKSDRQYAIAGTMLVLFYKEQCQHD